jgi:hypothetical protein
MRQQGPVKIGGNLSFVHSGRRKPLPAFDTANRVLQSRDINHVEYAGLRLTIRCLTVGICEVAQPKWARQAAANAA